MPGPVTDRILSPGLVVGLAAAADSLQPSLMPTPPVDQGIAAGASWVTAGLAATLVDGAVDRSARAIGVPPTAGRLAVAAAGAGVAYALRPRRGEPIGRAVARTAATVVSVSAATGAATAAGRGAARRLAAAIPGGRVLVPLAAAAKVAAGATLIARSRLSRFEADGRPRPELESTAKAAAVAAGMAGAVSGAAAGQRAVVRAASRRIEAPAARVALSAAAHGAIVAAATAAARAVFTTVLRRIETANNHVERAYAEPPVHPEVTAGPGSSIAWSSLGHQGRRWLLETATADDIREVMGVEVAAQPIRVYVGWRSADSLEARVRLAVDELRRAGAFERSLLIVFSPAGTGYVNYITTEAAEYMSLGDVASVSVQYGMRPSMLSFDRVQPGAAHHRALLEAIAAACAGLDDPPRVVTYGESLGAKTSQLAFGEDGIEAPSALGVDGCLYVGTPYDSQWKRRLFATGDTVEGPFAEFNSIDDVRSLDPARVDGLRFWFLDHWNDPVTKFGTRIAVQRPEWLAQDGRKATVSHTQRWTPIVTFWQTAIDTKNAARVIPGEFFATGHDYRADLAEFVKAAFGFPDVTAEQMARIEARLRLSEMERADRIALGSLPA